MADVGLGFADERTPDSIVAAIARARTIAVLQSVSHSNRGAADADAGAAAGARHRHVDAARAVHR